MVLPLLLLFLLGGGRGGRIGDVGACGPLFSAQGESGYGHEQLAFVIYVFCFCQFRKFERVLIH